MASSDDINSTEKLLELIRKPDADSEAVKSLPNPVGTITKRQTVFHLFGLQKKFIVGIDIGHTYIRLAKVLRLAEKNFELIDYTEIPLNKQVNLKDTHQLDQLKTSLDQMCSDRGAYEIWSAIPSAKVETRYLRIPKLPRHQIANAVYWTFTRKVAFNQQEEILDYEVLGDITEAGVPKMEVMAFKTPGGEVAELKSAFERIGYPLEGISTAPFSIQNLFRTGIIDQAHQDICCLYVGRDWSRIAIYKRGNLVLSRGIKAGMRSMVEAINIGLHGQETWSGDNSVALEMKSEKTESRGATVDAQSYKLFFDFIKSTETPEPLKPGGQPTSENQVFKMILPAMERLIRQVERTFAHYTLKFTSEGVRHIYLSGQITGNKTIVNHISQQLDLPVEVMNPFAPGSDFVRPVNIPESETERECYVPAIGLALSNNRQTPNTLFTHIEKDRAEDVRKINMRVLTGCMICLLALIGLFSWQERHLDTKRQTVETLNRELLTFNPPAEKEILLALYAKTKDKQKTFHNIVQRYEPVAVISELAQITPSDIRLIGVTITNRPPSASRAKETKKAKRKKGNKETKRILQIEGIIFGTPGRLESSLTSYMLTLKNSPMFVKPAVKKKNHEYYSEQEVLRFIAELTLH